MTESGRRYRLVGRAGHDGDGEYVWRWWVRVASIESWTDVTPTLFPDWRRAVPAEQDEGAPDVGDQNTYQEAVEVQGQTDYIGR